MAFRNPVHLIIRVFVALNNLGSFNQSMLFNKIICRLYMMIGRFDQTNPRIIKIADDQHGERDGYKINKRNQEMNTGFNAVHKAHQKANKKRYGNQ